MTTRRCAFMNSDRFVSVTLRFKRSWAEYLSCQLPRSLCSGCRKQLSFFFFFFRSEVDLKEVRWFVARKKTIGVTRVRLQEVSGVPRPRVQKTDFSLLGDRCGNPSRVVTLTPGLVLQRGRALLPASSPTGPSEKNLYICMCIFILRQSVWVWMLCNG